MKRQVTSGTLPLTNRSYLSFVRENFLSSELSVLHYFLSILVWTVQVVMRSSSFKKRESPSMVSRRAEEKNEKVLGLFVGMYIYYREDLKKL